MTAIDLATLAAVSGGMRLDRMRESTNVEDVRNVPPGEQRASPPVALPPLHRRPGDLASQAGLDSMIELGMRDKRRG
jgi:hypothetical protein